jgi:hypothetical protein
MASFYLIFEIVLTTAGRGGAPPFDVAVNLGSLKSDSKQSASIETGQPSASTSASGAGARIAAGRSPLYVPAFAHGGSSRPCTCRLLLMCIPQSRVGVCPAPACDCLRRSRCKTAIAPRRVVSHVCACAFVYGVRLLAVHARITVVVVTPCVTGMDKACCMSLISH